MEMALESGMVSIYSVNFTDYSDSLANRSSRTVFVEIMKAKTLGG